MSIQGPILSEMWAGDLTERGYQREMKRFYGLYHSA